VAHRFEAFEEALPCFRVLQAAAVAQSVACRHVAMFDGLGRLAVRSVQARPDVPSAWAGGRYGLDVRLMTIGDHCVWDHPGPLDGLPKERLSAGRVAALTGAARRRPRRLRRWLDRDTAAFPEIGPLVLVPLTDQPLVEHRAEGVPLSGSIRPVYHPRGGC
jgi:hypothetical protein